MFLYDLLYDVRNYIALPTVEDNIAIPSATDYTAILSTKDCFMIPFFASSILLNILPYTFDLRLCFIPEQ